MKKLIVLLTFFVASFANADPSLSMSVGYAPETSDKYNAGETQGFILSVKPYSCDNHCIKPIFVHISNDVEKNAGLGVDYTYSIKKIDSALNFTFGIVGFNKPLNGGENGNFHLGISANFEINKSLDLIIAYDHFSNGRKTLDRSQVELNIPVNMLSVGIEF